MRDRLRKIYEKNPASLGAIYIFLKIAFIVFGKYKRFKLETIEAIETFEGKDIGKIKFQKQYMKLIVFRYIYY